MMRLLVLAIFVLLIGCNSGKNKPDVSDIKVDIRTERFEQSFFKIDTNNIAKGLADVRNAHPRFYPFFMQNILQINPVDPSSIDIVKGIVGGYKSINDSIQKKYTDIGWLNKELAEGYK